MPQVSNTNFDLLKQVQSESTSKGNQIKFFADNLWYKLDSQHCYQGLAEEFASCFADCILNFKFVPYRTIKGTYRDEEYNACFSQNMYTSSTQFISLRTLFKQNNIPYSIFIKSDDIAENIKAVVEEVYKLTELNILDYLGQILFFDALIVNEDRHWMNLGICLTDNKYHIAPCFDNGSSLCCVNWTYRKRKTFAENMQAIQSSARPFSKFYDKQIEALQQLGCKPLMIPKYRLNQLFSYYTNSIYDAEQVILVKQVLKYRLNYYEGKGVYA